MKLQIFILHAGNDVIFETLESVKAIKVPHDLCIWYHALDEKNPINLDHFNRLRSYTDDVIMATKNQKCPAAAGFAMIYKEYDYFLSLDDDLVVLDGSVEKMLKLHQFFRRVGFIGEGIESVKMNGLYEINNVKNLPDWGGLITRECVNEIGARGAMFPKYGFDFTEWQMRAMAHDWKCINYKGLFNHGGKKNRGHETREKMTDLPMIHGISYSVYRACEAGGFSLYNWWANKI